MDINLKNCPFCGGGARLTHSKKPKLDINGTVIECDICGAKGEWFPVDTAYSSDEKAITAWNSRIES